ncbi:hypothetical protein Tco_0436757 [Tanacetum coccineum]
MNNTKFFLAAVTQTPTTVTPRSSRSLLIPTASDAITADKNDYKIQIKQLQIDNDELLNQIMSQDIMHTMNSVDICDVNKSCVNECSQSQEKDTVIRKLKEKIKSLSGKANVENVKMDIDEMEIINIELEHILNAQLQEKVFAITALKNELRKLKGKNVVDNAISKPTTTIAPGMNSCFSYGNSQRSLSPLDSALDYACKYVTRIQELLIYATQSCPSFNKPSEKLVAVTPRNKEKKVRFAEPVTSSNNISKQTDSLKTKDSNIPLLPSTGVNSTTSASGSKPSGNTKKNRISRPSSSNKKNEVEEHPRTVKSSLNKTNYVSEPISNALVKHSERNAKFNAIWKPTGRILTIVGNRCPLTRITSEIVPLKETTITPVITSNLKVVQIVLWYLEFGFSKHMTENRSQLVNFISKFLGTVRFRNGQIAKIMACALGKSKKSSHQPKAEDTNQEKLYLLHMDLYGLMHVESINGKKYILVIVDDYS